MIIGKEVTPRKRVVIIAMQSLPKPISYEKIKELTGISTSTANDIGRRAVENALKAQHEAGQRVEEPNRGSAISQSEVSGSESLVWKAGGLNRRG